MAFFNPVNLSLVYAQESTPIETPSESPSDSPTPTPTPLDVMVTGDAASDSSIQADTNISEVAVTPSPTPTETPEDLLESDATPSATPTPSPDSITIDQSGTVTSDSSANSNTGENGQTSSVSAEMTTGEAVSSASNINVTNLAEVNSNLITVVQTIYTGDTGDIDLYQLLETTIAGSPNTIPANTDITATQSADVTANTTAGSNTGDNNQNADTGNMQTGNAVSVASAINAVNLDLIGSNVVLAIINILGDYSGNIILPDGQTFSLASLGSVNANVTSNQSADVNSNTNAVSNTGGNTQTGGTAEMTTGTATGSSNSNSFVNLIQIGGGLGYLIINNSGNWTGNLVNWTAPGSVETLPQGTTNLSSAWQSGGAGGEGTSNITSNQTATVSTNVSANANTGGNTQTAANSNLTTGNAFSLANNLTLANITGVGTNFFFGIINIFGKWTGNIVSGPNTPPAVSDPAPDPAAATDSAPDTRSPDLQIDTWNNVGAFVYPGDTVLAKITVTNQGGFTAHNVEVKGQLTNDHPMPAIPMDWKIGDLKPGGKAKISFSITLTSNLPQGQYEISATATGDGDSGNESSVGSTSSFWVKVKGVITELTAPQALAESTANAGGNVLGATTSSKSPLDINKYLPYILASLAAAYIFIFFARRKLKEHEEV
jgi:hypothetical protein